MTDTVFLNSSSDVGAYFSREDIDKALYAGEPMLPVDYLVVDVAAGNVRGAKLFAWRNGRFECTREFGPSSQDE
ncbi:hypothetical protein NMC42_21690 [Pseudomonas aeruginosa]